MTIKEVKIPSGRVVLVIRSGRALAVGRGFPGRVL
jgi:hypothetical protein